MHELSEGREGNWCEIPGNSPRVTTHPTDPAQATPWRNTPPPWIPGNSDGQELTGRDINCHDLVGVTLQCSQWGALWGGPDLGKQRARRRDVRVSPLGRERADVAATAKRQLTLAVWSYEEEIMQSPAQFRWIQKAEDRKEKPSYRGWE